MSRLFPTLEADRSRLLQQNALVLSGHSSALRKQFITATVLFVALLVSAAQMDLSLARLGSGFAQLVHFLGLMIPPMVNSQEQLILFMKALAETLAISFLGTLLAAILALPFGFLAARTIVGNRLMHLVSRRFLDTIRGVDVLVWALIWINVVGLGPFAGILALMTADFGLFGKLFSEVIETADRRDIEGVASTGGGHWSKIRFGILPQVAPVMIGQVLYFFESNTRSATVIGIVGAGGIGLHLSEMVRTLEWDKVSFLVLSILILVAIIDQISSRIRQALVK